MTRGRTLKERLNAGERLAGGLIRMPSEETLEMMAIAGLDFVIIDCEHGPADVLALRQHIAFAQVHAMSVLVRVGFHEWTLVLRALDQGAEGIVAPHIDTSHDAHELVQAVHYPPVGQRGFATYSRAGRFGTVEGEQHRERQLADTLVIVMLESPTAVRNTVEIVTTPGVDGYLVGSADLRMSLGPTDPDIDEATVQIHRLAQGAGTFRADLAADVESAQRSIIDGSQIIVYNIASLMVSHFRAAVRHVTK